MFVPRVDKPKTGVVRRFTQAVRASRNSGSLRRSPEQRSIAKLLAAPAVGTLQAKLKVGAVNDPLEHEADRVADQVTRMPHNDVAVAPAPVQVSRKCAACEGEETLHRQALGEAGAEHGEAPPLVHEVLSSTGAPLDAPTRSFFEPRFGRDLGAVRVHTDAKAAQSAQAVQAQAYTAGSSIVFGRGQYAPGTASGQRLLAHELAHTLQQGAHAPVLQRQPLVGARQPRWQARAVGSEVLVGFALNSAALTEDHRRRLGIYAQTLQGLLQEYPKGVLTITGHTDATGGDELNERLGQQRAEAVADFLQQQGMPAQALVAVSAGETQLRIKTQAQEPGNRRAELRFDPSPLQLPTTAEQATPKPNLDASQVCNTRPELCEGRSPPGVITNGAQLPARCPNTGDCSAVSTRTFSGQPLEFQRLLRNSFADPERWFDTLNAERRFGLVAVYNRLCEKGLACLVSSIVSIDRGEPSGGIGPVRFKLPGLTVSVNFTTVNNKALLDALTGGGVACTDDGKGGALHPGQTSTRQKVDSDALHTSLGGRNRSDAHLDQVSPVNVNGRGISCNYDPAATIAHLGGEILPEKLRLGMKALANLPLVRDLPVIPKILKGLADVGLTNLQVAPDFTLTPTVVSPEGPRQDAAPPVFAGLTFRGPVLSSPKPLVPPESKLPKTDIGRISAATIETIRKALQSRIDREALLPPPLRRARQAAEFAGPDEEAAAIAKRAALERKSEYADSDDFGVDLAIAMARAHLQRVSTVLMPLDHYGSYGNLDPADRAAVLNQIVHIALLVRDYLTDDAAGVTTLEILFGSDTKAARGVIHLPARSVPPAGTP